MCWVNGCVFATMMMMMYYKCTSDGVTEATDDKIFPAPIGRNGRHFQRKHLSGVFVSPLIRQQLVAEFASRNCALSCVNGA